MLARFLEETQVTIVPFTERHYGVAVGAWIKYGKGRHPAALNFGDRLSYAIAQQAGLPLLCVGEDFSLTDVTLA
jgi:ribonuclease VapC